jgi:EAL domain-containing protein (putative c-di-GMP-specific phosphodiesterase class I)/CheY-like chemotaxis protein
MKTTPQRVLIIDDDPLVGMMTLAHLKAGGHEGRLTDDADEFMEICETWRPTFVVVDLVMEGTDGLEVLRRLATHDREVAVIIASGQETRILDAAHRFADANGLAFVGVLSKPYKRSQLLDLLSSHLDSNGHESAEPIVDRPWTDSEFEESFRDGLTSGAITVVFQPKIECADRRVVGYEALARWTHPDRGSISPTVFVAMAEKRGLVSLLTDSVMRQSLDWFGGHRHREGKRLSINVSAAELSDPDLDERLLKACQESGVPTDRVIIELTETSAMDDPVLSLQLLTRLRLQGFEVSLDDFGTGYSSMLQLAKLPFSEIKVDQSFVSNAATSGESVIVIRSIIDLGHALGLKCTAEGVEDAQVMHLLEKLGCDFAQGYHIGHPMVPDDLDEWLRSARH